MKSIYINIHDKQFHISSTGVNITRGHLFIRSWYGRYSSANTNILLLDMIGIAISILVKLLSKLLDSQGHIYLKSSYLTMFIRWNETRCVYEMKINNWNVLKDRWLLFLSVNIGKFVFFICEDLIQWHTKRPKHNIQVQISSLTFVSVQ